MNVESDDAPGVEAIIDADREIVSFATFWRSLSVKTIEGYGEQKK